jgi:hypothetical protein
MPSRAALWMAGRIASKQVADIRAAPGPARLPAGAALLKSGVDPRAIGLLDDLLGDALRSPGRGSAFRWRGARDRPAEGRSPDPLVRSAPTSGGGASSAP